MSDENPTGKPPKTRGSEGDDSPESAPKSSHKMIADIHSGIVMVAPVTTTLDDGDDGDSEDDASGKEDSLGDRDEEN